jgi:uncharacterized coiled-coil DUF342 family protein
MCAAHGQLGDGKAHGEKDDSRVDKIIAKLRYHSIGGAEGDMPETCEAAADEVERLRVENADLKRLSDSLRALSNALRDERDELRAKVERLRAERDDWKQCTETTKKFTDVKIERLRATLEIIVRHNENMSDWPHTIRGAQQVARAALEEK